MRRTLLLCAVLLSGCAKSEPPASTSTETGAATTAISLADVAGTWNGEVTSTGSDTVLALVQLTATAEPTGWSMTVTSAKDSTVKSVVPATNVVAEGDSLIVEAGPFPSVLRAGQQVATRNVYRLQEGNLVGTIRATYPASGEAVMLRTVATRETP